MNPTVETEQQSFAETAMRLSGKTEEEEDARHGQEADKDHHQFRRQAIAEQGKAHGRPDKHQTKRGDAP